MLLWWLLWLLWLLWMTYRYTYRTVYSTLSIDGRMEECRCCAVVLGCTGRCFPKVRWAVVGGGASLLTSPKCYSTAGRVGQYAVPYYSSY
jgi:hypothetical protein